MNRQSGVIQLSTVLLVLGSWLTSCTTTNWSDTAVPDSYALDDFRSELEQALGDAVARRDTKIPGATAAVLLPNDRNISVAVGLADVERNIAMRPGSRMMAGSVGKTFAAALALAMVAEGTISLDDKLSKWLGDEDWYPRLPNAGSIRLRHLLNHSAGLKEYYTRPAFLKDFFTPRPDEPLFAFKPRELISYILDQEPLFAAGTDYAYADANYLLLGIVLEETGGFILYHEVVRRFIYPLQLNSTSPQIDLAHPGMAKGYSTLVDPDGQPLQVMEQGVFLRNPAFEWTGGGFISTSTDLARWAKLYFGGKAMNTPYRDAMLTSVSGSPGGNHQYGLGVVIQQDPQLGRILRHAGRYFGYKTSVAYYEDHAITVAAQVNTDAEKSDIQAIRAEIAEFVLDTCRKAPWICG